MLTRAYLGDAEEANAADPVLSALEPADRATLLAEPLAGDYRFDVRLQGPGRPSSSPIPDRPPPEAAQ